MKIDTKQRRRFVIGPITSTTLTATDEQALEQLPRSIIVDNHRDAHLELIENGELYLAHMRGFTDKHRQIITELFSELFALPVVVNAELDVRKTQDTIIVRLFYGTGHGSPSVAMRSAKDALRVFSRKLVHGA